MSSYIRGRNKGTKTDRIIYGRPIKGLVALMGQVDHNETLSVIMDGCPPGRPMHSCAVMEFRTI